MKYRTKTALGIDIGDRRISAALVEKTERGFRVVASAAEDLPWGQPVRRSSTHNKALSRILRRLGPYARTRAVRTVVTTSAGSLIFRLLELPKQMPQNLGEFVENELKQYVAMSGRKISSDFCGIGTGERKRVLAVAADTTEVIQTLEVCKAAGLTPDSVEPVAMACLRGLLATDSQLRRGLALIAIASRRNLVLCVFVNGTFDFVRIREVPADADAPESLSSWLCAELNTVLQYSGMVCTDEVSQWQVRLILREVDIGKDRFADLPTREPNIRSLLVHNVDDRIFSWAEGEDQTAPPSLPAIGAALKLLNVEGDELRIDLTPEEVIQGRRSSRRGWIIANAAASVFVAVFLLTQFLTWKTDAINRRIEQNRIVEQLPTMPTRIAQDRFVDSEILRMTRELASLEPVRSRREVDWSGMLDSIGQSTPPGVCLTHVVCGDSQTLQLKGLALSPENAKAFVQNLDDAGAFISVRLTRIQRRQTAGEIVEYEINCVLKPIDQGYTRVQRT